MRAFDRLHGILFGRRAAEAECEELLTQARDSIKSALPFIQPRPDYANRAEGSFSEQIRAGLHRMELEALVETLDWLLEES
jgi:hypothetical protein